MAFWGWGPELESAGGILPPAAFWSHLPARDRRACRVTACRPDRVPAQGGMKLVGSVFSDLETALAAFELGPASFRCRICGRTHRWGSGPARSCALRAKQAPAPPVGLDAAYLRDAGIRLERAAEAYAPWLRLAPLNLPISWEWSPDDERVIMASLALPPEKAREELKRFYGPAVERWLEWALAEAERRKAVRQEALEWLNEVFCDVPRFFTFEALQGNRGELMLVRVDPRGTVPEGVRPMRFISGPYWAWRVIGRTQLVLWDFAYEPGQLLLLVSQGIRGLRNWYEVAYDAGTRSCSVRPAG